MNGYKNNNSGSRARAPRGFQGYRDEGSQQYARENDIGAHRSYQRHDREHDSRPEFTQSSRKEMNHLEQLVYTFATNQNSEDQDRYISVETQQDGFKVIKAPLKQSETIEDEQSPHSLRHEAAPYLPQRDVPDELKKVYSEEDPEAVMPVSEHKAKMKVICDELERVMQIMKAQQVYINGLQVTNQSLQDDHMPEVEANPGLVEEPVATLQIPSPASAKQDSPRLELPAEPEDLHEENTSVAEDNSLQNNCFRKRQFEESEFELVAVGPIEDENRRERQAFYETKNQSQNYDQQSFKGSGSRQAGRGQRHHESGEQSSGWQDDEVNESQMRSQLNRPRPPMKCYRCQEEGHGVRDCPEPDLREHNSNYQQPSRQFGQSQGRGRGRGDGNAPTYPKQRMNYRDRENNNYSGNQGQGRGAGRGRAQNQGYNRNQRDERPNFSQNDKPERYEDRFGRQPNSHREVDNGSPCWDEGKTDNYFEKVRGQTDQFEEAHQRVPFREHQPATSDSDFFEN